MIINHNLSAMYADRSLRSTQINLDKSMEKLSSGMRINRAGMMPRDWLYLKRCEAKSAV